VTLSALHFWLALIAIAADLGLIATSLIGLATRRWSRLWSDRLVLVVLGATGLAVLLGAGIAATSRPSPDALHIVYGAVALVVLPIARHIGRAGSNRRRAGWLLLGSVAQLAVYIRLFQTSG
jgi:hypothetical protein